MEHPAIPDGIPGSRLSGPWPVGDYAAALRDRLRGFKRVQVFGEVFGLKLGRAKVWFELRDSLGALPCSMWRKDWDALGLDTLGDGSVVVAAGGCDFYPGSRASSPSFSFAVTKLRVAGEGDLLAQVERLRKTLAAEGLFEPQKRLPRPSLPRCIGVVSGEGGKARDDVLAGLKRRGWAGRIVWAFAPVQDRHAAPAITRALQDLAACEEVEVIVVARGGGSLADLFAFCDETLCRTVALLRVPVIASVGHHTDRTLIDDVRGALEAMGVPGMTVTEVRGYGRQKGHTAIYRGKEYNVSLLPKVEIEVVVSDALVDDVIRSVTAAARTGEVGDGRIFVQAVEQSYNIRTGEKDA